MSHNPSISLAPVVLLVLFLPFIFAGCSSESDGSVVGDADVGVSDTGDADDTGNDTGDADTGDVDTNDSDIDAGDTGDSEDTAAEESCAAICARLESCDASIEEESSPEECLSTCENTLEEWGKEPIASFETCFVEDHDCDQLQQSDHPAQMCYDELEIPQEREDRCDKFEAQAQGCSDDSLAVERMRITCLMLGRTGGGEDWAQTDACVADPPLACAELKGCLNEVFELDPAL